MEESFMSLAQQICRWDSLGVLGPVVLPCETLQETSLRIPWPIHAGRGDGLWKSGYTLWGPRLIAKLVYLPRLSMFYGRDIMIYLYIYI